MISLDEYKKWGQDLKEMRNKIIKELSNTTTRINKNETNPDILKRTIKSKYYIRDLNRSLGWINKTRDRLEECMFNDHPNDEDHPDGATIKIFYGP